MQPPMKKIWGDRHAAIPGLSSQRTPIGDRAGTDRDSPAYLPLRDDQGSDRPAPEIGRAPRFRAAVGGNLTVSFTNP